MTRGYVVMAHGGYVDMATALAESIKKTQGEVSGISIITDQPCDSKLFDHVIPVGIDITSNTAWKIHNRAFFYDLSPYDETVILDADMLFIDDVSHWWDHFSNKYRASIG